MSLTTGTKLGPYEILELIGAGGMGEVYKARDTRLDRIVALKVSRDQFSERFEREARSVAALNHPNICALYDVGPNYLVMEFIEGENLSGPLPLDTAVNYARQIAEAIEAAHEKGIVHRDLKPANVKVTPAGRIKVLDFGLAKALSEDPVAGSMQDSPTLSMAMTRAGMILGTAAYMSPEQAKGKPADRRADIWAFGVVFYEILAGGRRFRATPPRKRWRRSSRKRLRSTGFRGIRLRRCGSCSIDAWSAMCANACKPSARPGSSWKVR
jgi:serine/threonine protein kinase